MVSDMSSTPQIRELLTELLAWHDGPIEPLVDRTADLIGEHVRKAVDLSVPLVTRERMIDFVEDWLEKDE